LEGIFALHLDHAPARNLFAIIRFLYAGTFFDLNETVPSRAEPAVARDGTVIDVG